MKNYVSDKLNTVIVPLSLQLNIWVHMEWLYMQRWIVY